MTQNSKPQPGDSSLFADAGPYTADVWAQLLEAQETIGRSATGGVIPTYLNRLGVSNPAGVTVRVSSGAAWVNGRLAINSADLDFTPTTPGANPRIDVVVVVNNYTAVAYNTGLSFPTDLTDYAGAASIPPYSARIAILKGAEAVGPVAPALVQTASIWMVPLAQYQISVVPALSSLTDRREFCRSVITQDTLVSSNNTKSPAFTIGRTVTGGGGGNELGTGVLFQLENSAGTLKNAGGFYVIWKDATAGTETARLEFYTTYNNSEWLHGVIAAPNAGAVLVNGNARGADSVDWQGTRSAATQVASGESSVIGGGRLNTASAFAATVGGGDQNVASGTRSCVPGGILNTASGNISFCVGSGNTASGSNAMAIGLSGSATHNDCMVLSTFDTTASWGDKTLAGRFHGGVRFYSAAGVATGVQLSAGGAAWGAICDRNTKNLLGEVDYDKVLRFLVQMPVYNYTIKQQESKADHIGPVAQEFNPLFEKPEDELRINEMDAIGVAYAAIKALAAKNAELEERIKALEGK